MLASTVVPATEVKSERRPIAFIDAVHELVNWAHGEGIECPNLSFSESYIAENGIWQLCGECGTLIARVGYAHSESDRVVVL